MIEVATDVRERVKGREHRNATEIARSEERKITNKDLTTLLTKELYERHALALAEIANIGEELARRSSDQERER